MKKKTKKAVKTAAVIAGTGVALSLGASVASDVGATETAQSMAVIGSKLPIVGGVVGAAMVLDATKELKPKKKRRKSEWEV